MHKITQKLGIDRLTTAERFDLLEDLSESIAGAYDLPIPESHKIELDRRVARLAKNPKASATWEEVKARLAKRRAARNRRRNSR